MFSLVMQEKGCICPLICIDNAKITIENTDGTDFLSSYFVISDIAIFVLKRDVKLQLTSSYFEGADS